MLLTKIENFLALCVDLIWGTPTVVILVLSGLGLSIYLGSSWKWIQFQSFLHSFPVLLGKYDQKKKKSPGEISHFQALTTALSATIGLGNIGIVAIVIQKGGPGAIFWMMLTGLIGMATKFAESTLAIKYRHTDSSGKVHGGPMYYIELGLGKKFRPLAVFYAFAIAIGSYGFTNMFQTNQVALILNQTFAFPKIASGIVIAVFAALVIIGGIKRIGKVTSFLVPLMGAGYIIGCLIVIFYHIEKIPELFGTIFYDAFNGHALIGGGLISIQMAMLQGVRRACFSNEAGLGSAAIAHSTAITDEPVREGVVASLGPFIDTVVICTLTALVILSTGVWQTSDLQGVPLTAHAFNTVMPNIGGYYVTIAAVCFAFSTLISWSFYGETATYYIFGKKMILPYKVVFCLLAVVGSIWKIDAVLNFSDIMTGLMIFPNLVALWILSPKVKELSISYFNRLSNKEFTTK